MENPTTDFGVALAEIQRLREEAEFSPNRTGQFAILSLGSGGEHVQSLEDLQERPNRIRAAASFVDAASFTDYVRRYATSDTVVLADPTKGTLTAAISYHEPPSVGIEGTFLATPSHNSHSATLKATFDLRYAAWRRIDGTMLLQSELGEFMEERAVDVTSMDGASVMEMVMKFEATKTCDFKSATRLADGTVQYRFEETENQTGVVKVPDHLIVTLPIYQGADPVQLKVMVRHRTVNGKLGFLLKILDRQLREESAFNGLVETFRAAAADYPAGVPPIYFGSSL